MSGSNNSSQKSNTSRSGNTTSRETRAANDVVRKSTSNTNLNIQNERYRQKVGAAAAANDLEESKEKKNNEDLEATKEGVVQSVDLAKNAATGNVLGAAKNVAKLVKNKKVVKTMIRNTLIQILAPFIIILIVAGAILGVFNAVADAIQGVISAIVNFFTVDTSEGMYGEIIIDDAQIQSIIDSIESLGVSVKDLNLLGDYSESATEAEQQAALEKYIRAFYEAEAVTETINPYYLDSTDSHTYGAVYVYRVRDGDEDGSSRKQLTYVSYERMQELAESGNENADEYFSVDDSGNLVIASVSQTRVNYGTGSWTDAFDRFLQNHFTDNTETTVTLQYMDYKSQISQYTTKMTFLLYLTMVSQNPEFVSAVVDLIKDSRIEITILDNTSTYVKTETYNYVVNTKTENQYWYEGEKYTWYTTSSSGENTSIVTTTTTTSYASMKITYVKTWFCEQSVTCSKSSTEPRELSNTTEEIADEEPENAEGSWITGTITTVEEYTSETYQTEPGELIYILGEKGDAQRYANGEIDEETFIGLMETEFRIPYSTREENAGGNLVSGAEILFYLLQKDADLENMETLMRYALYIYSGNDYGVTELDGSIFDLSNFTGITTGSEGGLSLTTTMFTRDVFIQAMQAYYEKTGNSNFKTNFLDHAGEIYDISVANNLNPELVVITARGEGNFAEAGGSYNYWGIGVPNGASSGGSYSSLEEGIIAYANVIHSYETGSKAQLILERYEERKAAGCDPLGYGLPGTLSGMQSIYSFLGNHEYGSAGSGGYYYMDPDRAGVTKIYATHEEFLAKCYNAGGEHASGTVTTVWEQGQYTAWQVEQKLTYWVEIFGDYGSLSSTEGNTTIVEIAKSKIGSPYVYGAAGPNSFDCSGFIYWVYQQAGITVPRSTSGYEGYIGSSYEISWSEAQPGDILIITGSERGTSDGHAAIYLGDDSYIHAPSTGKTVTIVDSGAQSTFTHVFRFY